MESQIRGVAETELTKQSVRRRRIVMVKCKILREREREICQLQLYVFTLLQVLSYVGIKVLFWFEQLKIKLTPSQLNLKVIKWFGSTFEKGPPLSAFKIRLCNVEFMKPDWGWCCAHRVVHGAVHIRIVRTKQSMVQIARCCA